MKTANAERYLINSPAGRAYVGVLDVLLRVVARKSAPREARPIEKLLLGIGGQIGDAVIASSALRWVGVALPHVSVGIAISSSARPILDGHPLVKWIHTVDHWKLNRSPASWPTKRLRSAETNRQARGEIREVGYDAAVDLYPFYPNMAVLLWRSGVPRRAGYISGGGGPVYTDPIAWRDSGEHMASHQRQVLRELGLDAMAPLSYDLPPLGDATVATGRQLLADRGLEGQRFVVFHPGSGDARKAWPLRQWSALVELLRSDGFRVALTGAGERDRSIARELKKASPDIVDLCGATDLLSLRVVLREAAASVAIDSAAAHLAAAEGTPGVAIMSAMTNVNQWRPLSPRVAVLMESASAAAARDLLHRQMDRRS